MLQCKDTGNDAECLSFPYLRDIDAEVPDSDQEQFAPQLSKSPHALQYLAPKFPRTAGSGTCR